MARFMTHFDGAKDESSNVCYDPIIRSVTEEVHIDMTSRGASFDMLHPCLREHEVGTAEPMEIPCSAMSNRETNTRNLAPATPSISR